MKRTGNKLQKQILFYTKKLPPFKQLEALDFIRWLWGGIGQEEEFTKEEVKKIESLSKKKGGVKFKNWQSAKRYLENLMR